MKKLREVTTRYSLADLVEAVAKAWKEDDVGDDQVVDGATSPEARPEGEREFVKLHKTSKAPIRTGTRPEVFTASNVKKDTSRAGKEPLPGFPPDKWEVKEGSGSFYGGAGQGGGTGVAGGGGPVKRQFHKPASVRQQAEAPAERAPTRKAAPAPVQKPAAPTAKASVPPIPERKPAGDGGLKTPKSAEYQGPGKTAEKPAVPAGQGASSAGAPQPSVSPKAPAYPTTPKTGEKQARYQPPYQSTPSQRTEVDTNMKAKVAGQGPPPTAMQKVQASVHGAPPPPTGAAIASPVPKSFFNKPETGGAKTPQVSGTATPSSTQATGQTGGAPGRGVSGVAAAGTTVAGEVAKVAIPGSLASTAAKIGASPIGQAAAKVGRAVGGIQTGAGTSTGAEAGKNFPGLGQGLAGAAKSLIPGGAAASAGLRLGQKVRSWLGKEETELMNYRAAMIGSLIRGLEPELGEAAGVAKLVSKKVDPIIKRPKFDARGNLVLTQAAKKNITQGKKSRKLTGQTYKPSEQKRFGEAKEIEEAKRHPSMQKPARRFGPWSGLTSKDKGVIRPKGISDKDAVNLERERTGKKPLTYNFHEEREPRADEYRELRKKEPTVLVYPKGYKGGGKVTRIPKSQYDPKKHGLAEEQLNEKNWIQSAIKKPGALTAAAHRAKKSVGEFAREHKHSGGKVGKRARLALTLKGLNKEETQLDELKKSTLASAGKEMASRIASASSFGSASQRHYKGLNQVLDRLGGTYETGKPRKFMVPGDESGKVYSAKKKKIYHGEETEQLDEKSWMDSDAAQAAADAATGSMYGGGIGAAIEAGLGAWHRSKLKKREAQRPPTKKWEPGQPYIKKDWLGRTKKEETELDEEAVLTRTPRKLAPQEWRIGCMSEFDERKAVQLIEEDKELNESGPTKKHFQMAADAIKAIPNEDERKKHAYQHAELYSKQNPRFNREKFYAAAGLKKHQYGPSEETEIDEGLFRMHPGDKHFLDKAFEKARYKVFGSGALAAHEQERKKEAGALDRMTKPSSPKRQRNEETELDEVITKSTPVGDVIHDFVHSKNKVFKGDSKKQRIKRALGAYYKKQRGG